MSCGVFLLFVALAFGSGESKSPEQQAQEKCEDKIAAFVMSQVFVKKQLRAPATADFPSYTDQDVHVNYIGDCTHEVVGYVDAQNAFGAKLRNRYYVKLQNQKGTDTWRALDVQVIGQ